MYARGQTKNLMQTIAETNCTYQTQHCPDQHFKIHPRNCIFNSHIPKVWAKGESKRLPLPQKLNPKRKRQIRHIAGDPNKKNSCLQSKQGSPVVRGYLLMIAYFPVLFALPMSSPTWPVHTSCKSKIDWSEAPYGRNVPQMRSTSRSGYFFEGPKLTTHKRTFGNNVLPILAVAL